MPSLALAAHAAEAAEPASGNDSGFFPITEPVAVLGILLIILAFVFHTSSKSTGAWAKFYTYVPALLICYFLPGVLGTLGLVENPDGSLYYVASRFLLPACLVLLTLSIDLKGIYRLGPKMLAVFFAATFGVIIGGPIAVLIVSSFSPDTVGGAGPDAVWRGLSTVAGSWIGGGANQTAMKEIFLPGDDLFSSMIAVDVIVANIWMGVLLYLAGRREAFDRFLKADSRALDELEKRVAQMHAGKARIPTTTDYMKIVAVAFGAVGVAFLLANAISDAFQRVGPWATRFSLTSQFFWLIILSTTFGLILSASKKARDLEDVGASKIATVFLYMLVTVIGLKMNLAAIAERPGIFLVGMIWISIQALIVLFVARVLRAPGFFVAVGSQANIGGAASAPVVAAAFNPLLAPVGVLLAVLGYAVGTYGAWLCAQLMQLAAQMQ